MTSQKAFKRRVRERMERTGERYVVAREQLLRDEPQGVLPETGALRELLADAGVEVSEDLALLLCGGMGFAAMGFAYADGFRHFHLSGWNPFQSDIVEAVRRLGLEADVHETGGAKAARQALEERLEAGRTVAVWLDGPTLRGDGEGLEGAGETVVVLRPGDDHDPERLAAARGRIRRLRHRLLAVGGGEADLATGIRAGLDRCVAGPSDVPKGARTTFGLDGILHWARRPPEGSEAVLREVAPAQDGLLRGPQARGLREAADLLGLEALLPVADRTAALADGWRAAGLDDLPALHAEEVAVRDALEAALAPAGAPALDRAREKTGHGYATWFARLDAAGMARRSHRDIAAHLLAEHEVPGWWAQTVTVAYEQARGRRAVHERSTGFEISVSRTVAAPQDAVFAALEAALDGWGLTERSRTAPRRIRTDAPTGRVHLYADALPDGRTRVVAAHERLPDAAAAAAAKPVWRGRLEELKTALDRP